MKNTGKCPKCSGTEIITIRQNTYSSMISAGFFTRTYCVRYVCGGCGFVEEYVETDDLPALKRKHQE
jgi:hypothetical protein